VSDGLSDPLAEARARILVLDAEVKLAHARLAHAVEDRDAWRGIAIASEKRLDAALAELRKLKGEP
jgi:hypothetical protein